MKGAVILSQELISKKELLSLVGISYGQLYRWKRKNLIPEEWFIKKSSFTGQETYFPKEKILERIKKIQNFKENLSLDELANMFSPDVANVSLTANELEHRNIVSKFVLQFYTDHNKGSNEFNFEKILNIFILDKLLLTGEINLDEAKMLLRLLEDHSSEIKQTSLDIIFIRKFGIASCLLLESGRGGYFEKGTKIVIRMSIPTCLEELKTKLLQ